MAADAGRALLLVSIPTAAFAGGLRIEQLYVAAFLEVGLGSFFDIAYRSYLPGLVSADRLLEANTKIGMTSAVAELGGPGIGGALVQLVSAPFAILVDAVSYVVSAVSIALIRARRCARRRDIRYPGRGQRRGARVVRGTGVPRLVARPIAALERRACFLSTDGRRPAPEVV